VTQWDIQSPALPAPRPSRDEFEPEDDE
jgi:hypothetical protein